MKKIVLACCLLVTSNAMASGYAANQKIVKVYTSTSGEVWIKTETQPSNTCSYYGYYLTFDSTTAGGKSTLSLILAAKATDSQLEFWYTASPAPGTNETSGCTKANLAILTGASLY